MSPPPLKAPIAATVLEVHVQPGARVAAGDLLLVIEAMKMEHELRAQTSGTVAEVPARVGEVVTAGDLLVSWAPAVGGGVVADAVAPASDPPVPGAAPPGAAPAAADVTAVAPGAGPVVSPTRASPPEPGLRPDLQALQARLAWLDDARRPEAVARRHATGRRTARENIADLVDAGSFAEYGGLALAAQASRRSREDLLANTPADGLVAGVGSINGALFGAERSRCVVMAYDATVLAGTQGLRNHQKTDRLLGIALRQRLPVVLFAEGGGGRPGDVDMPIVAGLHVGTFAAYARLSGRVPVVGIVAGRCFAGNAALLGCSDVVIATRDSNIGMGGPAMVEGGGLGSFAPEAIGPAAVQQANGVIDLLVDDEAAAVAVAKHYLGFFQGRTEPPAAGWPAPEPLALREVLPAQRARVYDMGRVIAGIVDQGSTLELRAGFGVGIHTVLARLEGRPVGLIANNPAHLGGAIHADAADKAARFLQLCDRHGLPIVSLIDTPGFMVGPQVEETAQVRHVSRMFVQAAHLRVPVFAVVLRKGYGLGAMAMAAGGFHAPVSTVAWPSGEFGAMGLEGAVRLGYRKELAAAAEGAERDALFERLLAERRADGAAVRMAETLEIDAVIDPADTRRWLLDGLAASRVEDHHVPAPIDPW